MEKDSQKNVVNHFEAGSNCQVFNGNITGCVFAMPGSTVTQQTMPETKTEKGQPDVTMLARAIENCQKYFWGNSSYGVVFCICRDDYEVEPNKSAFENLAGNLPYTKKLSYICTENTIATAFSNNPIFNENINNWDSKNPMARIIKLRDELRKQLNS